LLKTRRENLLLANKIACEIVHMEAEMDMLRPVDVGPLQGYFFEMKSVSDQTEDWIGYIVLPDDKDFEVRFSADTGKIWYDKNEAYFRFLNDASLAFPNDSCAVDTASAFLMVVNFFNWDDKEDY
jgi:hypothetical protein